MALLEVCAADELADADADGLADADADALAEAGAITVLFGLAVWLGVAVGLPQLVPVASAVGLGLLLGLELALGVAVAVAVAVAAGLPLALALPLPVGLPLPVPGLVDETDGVADGLVGVVVGFGELGLASGVAEGVAEDCRHDASGVGSCSPAGVVPTAAVPLPVPSGVPPPVAAEPVGPPEGWCLSRTTFDQDVVMAWRNGGTAARTTPTANTAQPTAKAGLSSSSRQSLACCGAGRA